MKRKLWLTASGLVLVLAGCGESEDVVTTGADAREGIQGTWYPQQIAGYTVAPEYEASYAEAFLEFDDGALSGSDGCNGMRGAYELDGAGTFDLLELTSTKIGCANVPHYQVLDESTRVEVDGDTLVFSAADEIARYTRVKNAAPVTTVTAEPTETPTGAPTYTQPDPLTESPTGLPTEKAEAEVRKQTEPEIPPAP